MRPLLICLLLSWPPSLRAANVELPAEVKGEPGNFLRVPAKTDCAELRWVALDSGLNLFPTDLLKDSRTAVVVAMKPGRYRLLAYGAKGDAASEPAICTVVVGNPAPPPPPTPPDDDLMTQLKAAYQGDASPTKATDLKELARLYRQAGESEVQKEEIKTALELFLRLQDLRRKTVPDSALLEVRRVVEKELNKQLPINSSAVLDASLRQKAGQLFLQIATRLETIP